MAAIFSAVDITGLTTGVTTIITGFIAVSLIFVAWRYTKKAGVK